MGLRNLKGLWNQKSKTKKKKNIDFWKRNRLLKGRQIVLNGFESKIFAIGKQPQGKRRPLDLACIAKISECAQITILTPEQILQRFLKAPA